MQKALDIYTKTCYNIIMKGGMKMRIPDKKEVLSFLGFIEKVMIKLIGVAGWIKILIEIFK